MQRPRIQISTGAWIFATGIGMALIGSAGVYAAANSVFAIGNPNGTTTALVTPTRQLQTVTTAPTNIIRFAAFMDADSCGPVYMPPDGKAIVVTEVTYLLGDGTQGHDSNAALTDDACAGAYDVVSSTATEGTESHTFPTGLPMHGVGLKVYDSDVNVTITGTGYLIPSTQLPPESGPSLALLRRMHRRR